MSSGDHLDARHDGGYAHVLRIAYPIIITSSSSMVMYFVDRIMLGHYSLDAMAGAMGGGMAAFTLLSLFLGTAGYTATFVAQYYGARRTEGIGPAVWQGVYFSLAAGALLAAVSFFAPAIMGGTGHSESILKHEIVYFRIMLLGAVFPILANAIGGFYNGIGRPQYVTVVQILANVVNIGLNYLLIFGKLGFPEMGSAGAAIATVASGALGVLVLAMIAAKGRFGRQYEIMRDKRFRPDLLRRLVRYGAPSGLQWMVDMIGFTAFILFVGRIGAVEMQAVTATFAINHLAFMPMIGFGIATSVLVGQFLGAERADLARRATRHAFEMTFAYMTVIAVVYVAFPEPLVRLFGSREASGMAGVVAYSVVLLRFVALYSIFDTGNIVYASALRGAGDTLYVVIMMAVLSAGLLVVPSYLVVEVFHAGLYWAMVGPTVYVIVLAIAFYLRYRTGRWEHMRVIEHAPAVAEPAAAAEGGEASAAP